MFQKLGFIFLFCFPLFVNAQLSQVPIGAKAMGMGAASATLQDSWAIFNNVAGMAESTHLAAGFAYNYPYGLQELSTAAAHVVVPNNYGIFGLGVANFGDKLFNEQKVSLGYARNIANVGFGVRLNYHQFSAQNYGSRSAPSLDLGSSLQLTKNIYLGTSILNILRAKIADFEDERIPTVIKIGISYRPTEKLILNLDASKDIDFDPVINAGVSYELINNLFIRTGISTDPTITYFGVGMKLKKFDIDYALSNHQVLGISQQLSILMNIKEFQKKSPKTE